MPDLNELLRWSIANSTPPTSQSTTEGNQQQQQPQSDEPLSLRFNPPSEDRPASTGSSAIHPSDPLYRAPPPDLAAAAPSTGNAGSGSSSNNFNSEILDMILGRPDSAIMKEKMALAQDESLPVDERVEALDDFEMLIESLDNANNMDVLKLWEPLLALLSSPHQSIISHACWIIGTAVQNNMKSQAALYKHNTLPLILDIIEPPSGTHHSHSARSRATYALSAAVKHWPMAPVALDANSSQGYKVLRAGVEGKSTGDVNSDKLVRRKMAFLVQTLVMQSGEVYSGEIPKEVVDMITKYRDSGERVESLIDGLKRQGVFTALVEGLQAVSSGVEEDIDFEENAMKALLIASGKGGLSDDEKKGVKGVWEKWSTEQRVDRGLGSGQEADLAGAL